MTSSHTPSTAEPGPGRRYALLIAAGLFEDPDLRNLDATVADAMSLSDLLRSPTIGGYEVTTAFNQSTSEVSVVIDRFFQERTREDMALIYISTHGLVDTRGRLFFAMSDTRHNYVASTALAADFIKGRMDDTRARQMVLLIDSSFSGAFLRGSM